MASTSLSSPTAQQNRIQELDIFRGFAIFGIFMVNILVMNVSFVYRGEWVAEQTGTIQAIALFILENFFFGKFFVIFSLLFGVGVALQLAKSKEQGRFSNAFFIRRFGSLFLFGIAHILFIWSGDILHIYGALGFLLLLFFRLPAKVLLWTAAATFLFPFYGSVFEATLAFFQFDYEAPLQSFSRGELVELKHNGNYFSGVTLRIKEYAFVMGYVYAGMVPTAFSMMLLGGYLLKLGVLDNLSSWLRRSKIGLLVAAIVLFTYRIILVYYVLPNFEVEHGSLLSILLMTLYYLVDIAMCLVILWVLGALMQMPRAKRALSPLSYVGRTALSNYILQSVFGYLIMRTFHGYEAFSPAACIVLVTGIFIAQIFLSKWWLVKFRFGPLEWLWRCISYKKILPIKK